MTVAQAASQLIEWIVVGIAVFGLSLLYTLYQIYRFIKWLNEYDYKTSNFGKRVS